MVHALGYSHTEFNAADPGRLCRGRERWVEPYEFDDPLPDIHRLVVSGAKFTDDSARDALRGVPHSGVELAQLIATLLPRKALLAFMEDGHPADIPEGAEHVEMYTGHRAGGRIETLFVRWARMVSGVRELREVLGPEPEADRVRGFLLLDPEVEVDTTLMGRVFNLVGMGCLDSPPARFQPAALHELLEVAKAVVLVHRDKHGPALGIYSRDAIKTDGRIEPLCDKVGALLVPFAIPPMLARWDRAIAEMRAQWVSDNEEPFPVPVSTEPSNWEPRRRGRKRRKEREPEPHGTDGEIDAETDADAPSPTDAEPAALSSDPAAQGPVDIDLDDLSALLEIVEDDES